MPILIGIWHTQGSPAPELSLAVSSLEVLGRLGCYQQDRSKATVNTNMCVMIDYPRFTLHGTKGSLTLPPVVHNSGKKKQVGRHSINTAPAGEDRWGTLIYLNEDGERTEEKVPVGCAH